MGGDTSSRYSGKPYGVGWNRRHNFKSWADRQDCQKNRSAFRLFYSYARWMLRMLSPYNLMTTFVHMIQSYAMAGQYCDNSAAQGVASVAMISSGAGGNFASVGGDDHHHHHYVHHYSSKGGKHAASQSFGSSEMHTNVILSVARFWGTMCGLSSAMWALMQTGGVGGVVAETLSLLWKWMKSCLAMAGLASGETDLFESNAGGGGGSKKNRKKQSQSNASSTSDQNIQLSSLLTGKLTFCLFPDQIRSHALHVQQMRTGELFRALEKTWEIFPQAQMMVAIISTLGLLTGWLFSMGGYRWIVGNSNANDEQCAATGTYLPNFGSYNPDALPGNNNNNHGSYWAGTSPSFRMSDIYVVGPPSTVSLILLIVTFGTAASLLFYGRVLLPIPEFVAGTNVLKAVRAEAKSSGSNVKGQSKHKEKDLPWAEQYKSITSENRLRLYYKVAAIRIIENVFLCAILPQTEIICRITEHCEPGPLLWGPSGVNGIAGRRFGKGSAFLLSSSYDALAKDHFVTRVAVFVTAFVTASLLVSQMTLMSRSYLAIMGYICGEWGLVREEKNEGEDSTLATFFGIGAKRSLHPPLRRSNNANIMQWDPKRKYQKGDRIAFEDCIYEALSNSPEGLPFDPFLRAAADLYSDEFGHPGTSSMLTRMVIGCGAFTCVLLVITYLWRSYGWNWTPLFLCALSTLVGGHAIARVAFRKFNGTKQTTLMAKEIERWACSSQK